MSQTGETRIGTMHVCPKCGGMRPNNLSEPCLGCKRREEDQEWQKQHPNVTEYLLQKGWQMVHLEKGFPGHRDYLGWWHEKHCLVEQRYFMQDEAVRVQRLADEGKKPRIISAHDGFKVL